MKSCGALLALLLSTVSAASYAQELRTPDARASANTADEQSKAAFEAGTSHYERGEFHAAAESFREAHELSPQPALLYNLAQAERLDGQCERALAHYEEFVAGYSGAGPTDIDEKIAEMKRCVQALHQRAETASIVLETQQEKPEHAATAPTTSSGPIDRPAKERPPVPQWVGWSAAAIGAAGLIAGAVMGALVLKKQSIVEETCPNKQCHDQSGIAAADDGKRLLVGSIAALGVGAAGAGLAIYVWTNSDSQARAGSARTSTMSTSVVVTWAGRF